MPETEDVISLNLFSNRVGTISVRSMKRSALADVQSSDIRDTNNPVPSRCTLSPTTKILESAEKFYTEIKQKLELCKSAKQSILKPVTNISETEHIINTSDQTKSSSNKQQLLLTSNTTLR